MTSRGSKSSVCFGAPWEAGLMLSRNEGKRRGWEGLQRRGDVNPSSKSLVNSDLENKTGVTFSFCVQL